MIGTRWLQGSLWKLPWPAAGAFQRQAGRIDPALVSVVWETPPFPGDNWTVRGDVECRDSAILASLGRSGSIAAANAAYAQIEQVALATDLLNLNGRAV